MALKERSFLFKAALAGTLVAAFALSACGRKGMPEAPPGAAVTSEAVPAAPGTPPGQPAPKKPDKPFALDFLL